jgi:hypothetical protein
VQCGDVIHAQSLFDRSLNKISPMYGAMMKGNNHLELFLFRIFCLGYIKNNQANIVIDLFNEIKNPDELL